MASVIEHAVGDAMVPQSAAEAEGVRLRLAQRPNRTGNRARNFGNKDMAPPGEMSKRRLTAAKVCPAAGCPHRQGGGTGDMDRSIRMGINAHSVPEAVEPEILL